MLAAMPFGKNIYFVSDAGYIFTRSIKEIKAHPDKDGYLKVRLWNGKSYKNFFVHRLIAKCFIPNPDNKPQINHKDGNKKNNTVFNLEWVTQSENMKHSFVVLGNRVGYWNKGRFGKDSNAKKIVLQIKGGEVIAEFYGCMEAERVTGINFGTISNVCRGKGKTAGGYNWKYKK